MPAHTHGIPDLPTGSLFVMPTTASHYLVAAGPDSTLQVFGVGPFDVKWVDEQDNPAAGKMPPGMVK